MGVYIKDMEMPDNCALCPMWDAGNCLAASEAIICSYDKRPQDCPLATVPPHGDLIDRREAIIDANERAYDFWLSDDEVNATIRFLNEQTTIIIGAEEAGQDARDDP